MKDKPTGTKNTGASARRVLENAINGAPSSKLEAVIKELHAVWEQDPGSKVLIFSQFLGFLDLIEAALKEKEIPTNRLDGSYLWINA